MPARRAGRRRPADAGRDPRLRSSSARRPSAAATRITPADYDEFKQVVEDGWADVWWCGQAECEAQIKEDTKATTRCIPLDQPGGKGRCIRCGQPAAQRAIFARSY